MGNKIIEEAGAKEAFVRRTLERLFIHRLMVLYAGGVLGEEFLSSKMEWLLKEQHRELRELGLPEEMIRDIFLVLEGWAERDYQLVFTYFAEEDKGPSYKLTFVDEMDKDPEVIAMRAMMKRAEGRE